MAKDKALTGAAGAYYVAFRLTAMEYAVGLTAYGTRSIDLLVANPDTGKSVTIQTKTMKNAFARSGTESWRKWRIGKPPWHASLYAFIDLKDKPESTPDVYIVKPDELEKLVQDFSGDYWCDIYPKDADKYLNRWDIIEDALKQSS